MTNAVTFKGTPSIPPAIPPSDVPRMYEGMQIAIYGTIFDPQTKVQKASSRCTVARYILVGQVIVDAVNGANSITIRGGRGAIGGDDDIGTNGFTSKAAISANNVYSKWRAQLSAPGSLASFQKAKTEAMQVVSSSAVTFTVAATLGTSIPAPSTTLISLTADTPYSDIPANTHLQLGDLTSGEVVAVSSACTAIALTGSGLTSTCTILRWWPTSAQISVAVGTKATRVTYTQQLTPPLISFTISTTALTAGATTITLSADTKFTGASLVVGDVLLVNSEAIKSAPHVRDPLRYNITRPIYGAVGCRHNCYKFSNFYGGSSC